MVVRGSPARLPHQHGGNEPLLTTLHERELLSGVRRVTFFVAALACVVVVSVVVGVLGRDDVTVLKDVAKLPNGWMKALDTNHRTYYYNQKLGKSSWDPPGGVSPSKAQAMKRARKDAGPTSVHGLASATPDVQAEISSVSADETSVKSVNEHRSSLSKAAFSPNMQRAGQGITMAKPHRAVVPQQAIAPQQTFAPQRAVVPPQVVAQQQMIAPQQAIASNQVLAPQQPVATQQTVSQWPVANKAMPPYFARSGAGSKLSDNAAAHRDVDGDDSDDDMSSDLGDNDSDWSDDSDDKAGSSQDDSLSLGDADQNDSLSDQDDSSDEFDSQKRAPHVSTLADSDVPKAEKISDISHPADWPTELPGAVGDGPSWIVGMHREPLWSDSYQGCSPFEYCDKNVADRGHKFQRSVNPYVDKRRTFDPYAMTTQEGRNEYPWDPTRDPQVFGTGDCSDGNLKDECWKKPSKDTLQGKQDALRKQYDEFYPDNIRAGYKESADKAQAADFAKHGLTADGKPLPPVSTRDEYADGGGAALRAAQPRRGRGGGPRYVGGRPVADTLGTILRKVDRQVPNTQKSILHDLSRDGGSMMHDVVRLITSMFSPRRPTAAAATELLSKPAAAEAQARLVSAVGGRKGGKASGSVKTAVAKGKKSKDVSIWESPLMVEAKGLFGIKDPAADKKAAAAAAAELSGKAARVVQQRKAEAKADGEKDPLLPISAEVKRVVEGDNSHKAAATAAAAGGKRMAGWQEATMQKGALRRESTAKNLRTAVQEHDAKLLRDKTGFSPGELAALERDADTVEKTEKAAKHSGSSGKDSAAATAAAASGEGKKKAVTGWEEKVMQKGALKKQSVEDNLRAALSVREVKLLEKEAGWKSEAELAKAEKFAENLQRAMESRRKEEAAHPLVPADAESALATHGGGGAAAEEGVSQDRQKKKELSSMEWEVVHNNEVRVVQRIREEEPIVKAYEAQVKNDEREFKDEVAEEDDTLTRLRKDQTKLAAAVQKQGAPVGGDHPHPRTRRTHSRHADGDDQQTAAAAAAADVDSAAAGGNAQAGAAPAADKLSARAADKDLNSYFDSMAPAGGSSGKAAA